MGRNGQYTVKGVVTTFDVLDVLRELESAGATEVASHLDVSKGAVHKHLKTLEQIGYVVRDGTNYRVGLQFLDVGLEARRRLDVYDAGKPEVDKLARNTGERAVLVVAEDGHAVFLYSANGDDDTYDLEGRRGPLSTSTAGRAILAYDPEERSRHADEGVEAELRKIRDQGYAIGEEQHGGVNGRCVAAPINGDDGATAALGVVGTMDDMSGKRFEEDITGLVYSATKSIEADLLHGS